MMKPQTKVLTALFATSTLCGLVYLVGIRAGAQALAQQLPTHQEGEAKSGVVVVELCDGVTRTEVKGLKPGQAMSHEQALAVTHSLMAEWERKHPDQHWEMAQDTSSGGSTDATNPAPAASTAPEASPAPSAPAPEAPSAPMAAATEIPKSSAAATKPAEKSQPPSGNPVVSGSGHKQGSIQQGDTYASFNERDFKVWQANTDRFVQQGKQVFHDANLMGGTIGVSCDMCHPDASNTHPETYPKYQVQLQRVALLRDMIEWCIENPVKGKTMDPNDPRLRALEAYILAQRKGVPLDYGKH
jgi:thiosulfate dehydrogenase